MELVLSFCACGVILLLKVRAEDDVDPIRCGVIVVNSVQADEPLPTLVVYPNAPRRRYYRWHPTVLTVAYACAC